MFLGRALALAKALLLGYRHELSSDLLEGYKQAGAMHILAISGLHVGIILFALLRITRSMSRHRTGKAIQLVLVVFGLWGYALITGMSVSAVRAVSMFSLLTLGRSMNRDTGLMRNLVTSAMILLMIDPLLVFDVGFQLSYSALAGIGLFTPLLKRSREKFSPAGNYILQILVVSCAAQLGVLPLSLLYFKQFSGVFLISSLALLPVLGFTLAWGYAIVVFSIFARQPAIVGSYYEQWLQWINITVETIGSADVLILKNVYYPMSFCLLTYLLISLLYLGIRKNKIALVFLFGLLLLIMQLEWLRERRQFLDTEELIVFHLWKESLIVKRQGNQLCTLKPSSDAGYRDRVLKEYGSLFPGRILTPGNCEDERRPAGFAAVGSDLVMVLDDTLGRAVASNPWKLPNPEVLVLVNSPRINLERLLGRLMPEKVVADGSNYPSFAKRWRETCKLRGIAFHDTSVEGAFLYRPRI